MRRRPFTAAVVLSALTCVGAGVLWVPSSWTCDYAYSQDERTPEHATAWVVASFDAAAWLCHERYDATARQSQGPRTGRGVAWGAEGLPSAVLISAVSLHADDPNVALRHRWPAWSAGGDRAEGSSLLVCPYWCACLATAAPPACALAGRWRRQRRAARGLCPNCGYDLRASPECCPECGTTTRLVAPAERSAPQ